MTADSSAPNPYFVLDPPPGDQPGWHTMTELISGSGLLRAKVTATAAALGTDDLRVAASIDHLGVTARIVSPVLAHLARTQTVPPVSPDRMWWRPAQPGPMALAAHLEPGLPATPMALLDGVVRPVLVPLLHAYGSGFHVSSRVLRGNVASALDGARRAIDSTALDPLVRDVLGLGELSGTAAQLPPAFRRASCCLLYRVPGRGLCGDCVLTPRA